MKSKPGRGYWQIGIILALAFALRLANTISIGDGYYANFLSDASTYRLWASKIAAGASYGGSVFPMGPLYPYFLALCLDIGLSFYSVLFLQAVFGTAVVFNIHIVAKRIFDKKAGLIAAFMAAIYGPFVFYDGLLLSESLQLLLVSSALILMIPGKKKKQKSIYYLLAGILIGLTALGRGTILLFPVLVAVYWFYIYLRKRDKVSKRLIKQAVLILAGAVCGILPATLHNISNGEIVPISSNFGINFYIGNNSEATGAYDEPAGLNLSSDFTGRQIAEREMGRELKSAEVSDFWLDRTVDFITGDPIKFLTGIFKKAWLYFWYYEIPQAEAIQIHRLFSPVFWVLPKGYWFILIPGLMGIIMTGKNESKWILVMLLLSSLLGGMIFFVIGRFRLIGSVALLIFAGEGIYNIYHYLKEKNRAKLIWILSISILALLILFLPRPIDKNYKLASAYDNVGISYFFKHQPDRAIKWYRLAAEIKPGHTGALNNIGGYFYTKQQPDSAIYYFQRAIESDSTDDKPYQNIGRTFLNAGMADSALYYYKKAKSLSPYGVDVDEALKELEGLSSDSLSSSAGIQTFDNLFGLAEKYSARREFDKAESYYRRALEIRPDDIRALNNLGFAFQAQGKFDDAMKMFDKVIEITGGGAIVYNNLASILYRKGLPDSAEVVWEKALTFDPDNQQIKNNLDFLRKSRHR